MMDDYGLMKQKVHQALKLNLSLYKETQMKRRITTLRDKYKFKNYVDYFAACQKDPKMLEEFTEKLTINVSEFYRNPNRWDVLQNKIIPALIKGKKRLTIWSAACSTGEEPYSLAMMLEENFPNINYQIRATDFDQTVLKAAKEGNYQERSLKELPAALKKKYFTSQGTIFQVDPALRKHIRFERHNLLEDDYPTGVDLIVCRNVLIYFTDDAKNNIFHNFSKALTKDGCLFVGSTEQIFNPEQFGFYLEDSFFYRKD
ncbi:protein-glutamate O-methyltransferase CheR [Oceanobacillus sp. J11TS1]|uniref:CheR family methyltransferase n=1 Tax=Oceanobacillus sp. J11TS1 TaxID=2807191 RepID=UPI001B18647E|nr:protein-glutamate O-methyltransferase CheR [Oceanobacillus sp. J11TS1]GIO22623.1 chemotaxis protein methyltransferase [Oceanobacillus sp. J11TS1]